MNLRVVVGMLVLLCPSAFAQSYPSRPVRIVLPYTPGGPTDIVLRIITQRLSDRIGQPIVIDNRGGASGMIGSELVAKAVADGYTLLFGTIQTHGVNPSLFARMAYDPIKDFVPVAPATTFPLLLTVHTGVRAASVKELIALARSQPGRLNYSSAGSGTGTHLSGELLKQLAELDIVHVPYKGGGEALADVVAGRIQITFTGLPTGLPHVKAGTIKALAISSARRARSLPDIPAVAETLPGFDVSPWNGVFAPKGTPAGVVTRLNAEVATILRLQDVEERLTALGADAFIGSPADFASYVKDDVAKWAKLVKAAGIKAE